MLDPHRVVMGGQAEPSAEATDVGVDRETGCVEGDRAKHVGRLAADPRKAHEVLDLDGNLYAEPSDDAMGHADQVRRLRSIEPCGVDQGLNTFLACSSKRHWRRVASEERWSHRVDPDVRALGREDGGSEELERRLERQRTEACR